MSKHEQHAGHTATAANKAGGCCGGAHDHEEAGAAEQGKKLSKTSHGSHTHSAHGADDSCGCGSKHK